MSTDLRLDRGSAAVELLGTLYPPPLTVAVSPTDVRGARAVWTAVPSATNPRLLLPGEDAAAATRTLRRQMTGRRLRTRVARGALTVVARAGLLARVSRLRVAVDGPQGAPSIEDPLRKALGIHDIRITMPIGPARSNRKPVLQVTDRDGEVLAFAKVGINELTGRLVKNEAGALAELVVARPDGVRPPAVIADLEWRGHEVLVLEPLVIPGRRLAGAAARRRLEQVCLAVAATGGGLTRHPWAEHPYAVELRTRVERCGDLAGALAAQLERMDPALVVLTGSWHGDLNPGNLALVAGDCPVWDWERFEKGVPLGFDLLHHDLHESITVLGGDPRAAAADLVRKAEVTLSPLGVRSGAGAVARLYLITLACRYLADRQAGNGAELGRVGEWLLPALEEVDQ